jgi:menaquinol-cytochrome c reductase cytochrome b/c subunit
MARDLGEQNREEFARYKDDVKREGKSFTPFAVLHDTIMGVVVLLVIIGLAFVWYYDADKTEAGILGPWYEDPAEPGTTDFVPRPEWYFYFLFYLLRIFEWPETVVIGTVGIPTIAIILLLALPFYDRRRERRPSRRPVAMVAVLLTAIAMAVLTYKGATVEEALGSELIADRVPEEWARDQGFVGDAQAEAGATLFAETGCLQCHTYSGHGTGNLGAPELSEIGRTNDQEGFVRFLSNPAAFGNTVMGSYAYLGEENLNALGAFLAASDGGEEQDDEGG